MEDEITQENALAVVAVIKLEQERDEWKARALVAEARLERIENKIFKLLN